MKYALAGLVLALSSCITPLENKMIADLIREGEKNTTEEDRQFLSIINKDQSITDYKLAILSGRNSIYVSQRNSMHSLCVFKCHINLYDICKDYIKDGTFVYQTCKDYIKDGTFLGTQANYKMELVECFNGKRVHLTQDSINKCSSLADLVSKDVRDSNGESCRDYLKIK